MAGFEKHARDAIEALEAIKSAELRRREEETQ